MKATRGGCAPLVKTLVNRKAWKDNDNDAWRLHEAILAAIAHGQTAIVRYFLDANFTKPLSTSAIAPILGKSSIGVATQTGHPAMLDLLLSMGAEIDAQTLVWAILHADLNTCPKYDFVPAAEAPSPEYRMVRHLVDIGATIHQDIVGACERQAIWIVKYYYCGGQFRYDMAERIPIVVFIAAEMKKCFDKVPLSIEIVPLHIKTVLRLILNGKLVVDATDRATANEVMDWVDTMRRGEVLVTVRDAEHYVLGALS
jgi:hypothetical protein